MSDLGGPKCGSWNSNTSPSLLIRNEARNMWLGHFYEHPIMKSDVVTSLHRKQGFECDEMGMSFRKMLIDAWERSGSHVALDQTKFLERWIECWRALIQNFVNSLVSEFCKSCVEEVYATICLIRIKTSRVPFMAMNVCLCEICYGAPAVWISLVKA